MTGEVESRLTGRVPCPNEMNIETLGGAHFAARSTVVDSFADELVQALDGQPTPRDPRRKNDGFCSYNLIAVEDHLACRRVYPTDRPGHKDFGPQPLGLLQCPACEL